MFQVGIDIGSSATKVAVLKDGEIYNEIYKKGKLKFEIETFTEDGKCTIKYYR